MKFLKFLNRSKFHLLAVLFFGIALICFFTPFIWQIVPWTKTDGTKGYSGGSNNGVEAALNFAAMPKNLVNFMALFFTLIGLIIAIVLLIKHLIQHGKYDPEYHGKEIKPGRVITWLVVGAILCGVVPFFCCSLTLTAYGLTVETMPDGRLNGYFLGDGAPLAAVFALLGGICMFYSESGFSNE